MSHSCPPSAITCSTYTKIDANDMVLSQSIYNEILKTQLTKSSKLNLDYLLEIFLCISRI